MNRSYRRIQSGQSIVLLALMIVVIVGMVGLSVDVGNAHGQQRRMQNAANAGALGGLNAVLYGKDNSAVWTNIQRSLAGNKVAVDGAPFIYQADYLDSAGNAKTLCRWAGSGGCPSDTEIGKGVANPPKDVSRIQVTITERVDTYFARVVGRNYLTVGASGDACPGHFAQGVYPLAVPIALQQYKVDNNDKKTSDPYQIIYQPLPNGSPNYGAKVNPSLYPKTPGDWDPDLIDYFIYLPLGNNDGGLPGAHIAWLSWSGANGASTLQASWQNPGSLQEEFNEGPILDPNAPVPANPIPHQLDINDWINGDTGVKATIDDPQGQYLASLVKKDVLLPMYDEADKNGETSYHFVKMGRFQIWGYDLQGGTKYFLLKYKGDASGGTATECATAP